MLALRPCIRACVAVGFRACRGREQPAEWRELIASFWLTGAGQGQIQEGHGSRDVFWGRDADRDLFGKQQAFLFGPGVLVVAVVVVVVQGN